jgi:hypothetical protein
MIETLRTYSEHSLLGVLAEGIPELLHDLDALVNRVALTIIVQCLISLPLFYFHHNLFALGFVVGFVFDKQVRLVVDKVNVIYNAHRTFLERFLFFAGGGFLAILTMPTSMVIATLYYSSQWGALLYQGSLNRYRHSSTDDCDEADQMERVQKQEVDMPLEEIEEGFTEQVV